MSKRNISYLTIISILVLWLFIGCEKKDRIKIDEPRVEVIESSNEFLEFRVYVPKFKLYDVTTKSGTFQRISPPNLKHHMLLGGFEYVSFPEVPILTTNIALPMDGDIGKIEIRLEGEPTILKARLYPVQKPLRDTYGEKDSVVFEFNEKRYLSRQTRIKDVISVSPLQKSDINIHKLSLNLIDYDPTKTTIQWYPTFVCKIQFKGKLDVFKEGLPKITKFKMDQIDKYYESIYCPLINSIINKNTLKEFIGPKPILPRLFGSRLLIITHPDFLSASQDLRNHKISIGISTEIVTTQIISDKFGDGTGNVTDEQIKDYIKYYYNGAFVRPKWLLLMGDSEFIPTHYTNRKNSWDNAFNAGDQFYGQLDDNNLSIPVFGIGRLPIDTNGETDIIVNKIIEYENNPPFALNSYYGDLTFAALFQDDPPCDNRADRWFAETSEHIRNYLLTLGLPIEVMPRKFWIERIYWAPAASNPTYWFDGSAIPDELKRPNFDWNGSTADIINAVNGGTSILFHRDHGSWSGWGDPVFRSNDIFNINITGNEFPVVFSINCRTGIFDNETVDLPANIYDSGIPYGPNPGSVYWAETFIRYSDGAIGVIGGGTRSSGSHENNTLVKGLFDAVFPLYDSEFGSLTSVQTLGDVLNHAKLYLSTSAFSDNSVYQENTIYNLLGDPTISVRAKPCWHVLVRKIRPLLELEHVEIYIEHIETKFPSRLPLDPLTREKVRAVAQTPKEKRVIGRGIEDDKGVIRIPIGNYRGKAIITFSSPDIKTTKYTIVVR